MKTQPAANGEDPFVLRDKFKWGTLTFVIVFHLMPFGLLWTGVNTADIAAFVILYLLQGLGITIGYHRYFAHKTFKTGRVFQFIMAWIGTITIPQGILKWAAQHRHHHKTSDTERDFHSPIRGFMWAHFWWMFHDRDFEAIRRSPQDLWKYPELRFLDKYMWLPPAITGVACYMIGGASMLFGGFFLSMVFVIHVTSCINSLAHVLGSRRYATSDTSRNNPLLALFAFGEGWHNNHHHYPASARNGFFWWEFDVSYYLLKVFSWFGLVWDLHEVPEMVKTRNLVSETEVDEGEVMAAQRREQLIPKAPAWTKALMHIVRMLGAVAVLTLGIIFGALNGPIPYIVGVSIFGASLLAYSILHFWELGQERFNLFLLIGGAMTPIFLGMTHQYTWAWVFMGIAWFLTLSLIGLSLIKKEKTYFVENLFQVLLLSLMLAFLIPFADVIPSQTLLFLAATLGSFYTAYRFRAYFEKMHLVASFHMLLVKGSFSYFFFLNDFVALIA